MASQITFDILARDRASRTFDNVGKSADGLSRNVGRFGKVAGAVAVSSAAAIGLVGAAGIVMGVKVAAGNEQARISFTTMLGSAKKADVFLRQLQAFAAKTPFEFPELQQAASSLISAGIEAKKVIPIMTTLGDVTSGMGTGSEGVQRATIALQQMNAAGRITGEDLNQLRDAGIPVYDLLAKATGKSKAEVVKLAQAGKLGHKELGQMMKALETGKGLERFSGLMDKQSKSLTGMWSTFKDTLGQGLAKVVEPLIPLLKDGLGGAASTLGKILAGVSKTLQVFMWAITGGSELNEFDGALRVVNNTALHLHSAFVRFKAYFTGQLMPAFQKAWKVILPGVQQAMSILTGGLGKNQMTWKQVGDVISQKVIPVVALIIRSYLPVLATNIRTIIGVIQVLVKAFRAYAAIATPIIRAVASAFMTAMGVIVHAAASAFGWVPGIGKKLKTAAAQFDTFQRQVNAALNGIHNKTVTVYLQAQGQTQLLSGKFKGKVVPLAQGGIVKARPGGTLALVGEAGHDEAVVPLSGPHARGMGGGGDTFIFNGVLASKADVGAALEAALLARQRQKGGGQLAFRAAT